jgi:hypothetical protein
MDLDHARKLIREAPDKPPFSDILLDLIDLVGRMDDHAARLQQRVAILEGSTDHAKNVEQLRTGGRAPYDALVPKDTPDPRD